jgi:hypothetical protein
VRWMGGCAASDSKIAGRTSTLPSTLSTLRLGERNAADQLFERRVWGVLKSAIMASPLSHSSTSQMMHAGTYLDTVNSPLDSRRRCGIKGSTTNVIATRSNVGLKEPISL